MPNLGALFLTAMELEPVDLTLQSGQMRRVMEIIVQHIGFGIDVWG
jgi:hypothetical protein